jgi:hypothetical protein
MHGAGYTGPNREREDASFAAALSEAAARNLPVPYHGPSVTRALLDAAGKPLDENTSAAVRAMQQGIWQNAQAPRGINEQELASRRTINARPNSVADRLINQPAYELGEGDQQNYRALRDSNILNAALGQQPVPDVDHLRLGSTHGQGGPNPSWRLSRFLFDDETNRRADLQSYRDEAAAQWHQGERDPARWGNLAQNNYPQHSVWGFGGPLVKNVQENNGGSIAGDVMSWLGRWDEGGNRAMTTPDKPYDPMENRGWEEPIRKTGKWLTGAWQGAQEEMLHRDARSLVQRASPILPGDMNPGSTEAEAHLEGLKGLIADTERPSVEAHAAARGEPKLDTAQRVYRNNRFVWADPFTAASIAFSGGAGALGKGALKAGLAAAGREVVNEGLQPLNYAGVLSSLVSPYPENLPNAQEFKEQRDRATQAFETIPKVMKQYRGQ